jgi:hypothetical protein
MASFTLTHGQRYKAMLTLGWLESFASNDMIAGELAKAGFTGIEVEGSGENRVAHGVWSRDTMNVPLPEQVTDMVAVA